MKRGYLTYGYERQDGSRGTITSNNKKEAIKFLHELRRSGRIKDNFRSIGNDQIDAFVKGEI
jgi:hypothetical protein